MRMVMAMEMCRIGGDWGDVWCTLTGRRAGSGEYCVLLHKRDGAIPWLM